MRKRRLHKLPFRWKLERHDRTIGAMGNTLVSTRKRHHGFCVDVLPKPLRDHQRILIRSCRLPVKTKSEPQKGSTLITSCTGAASPVRCFLMSRACDTDTPARSSLQAAAWVSPFKNCAIQEACGQIAHSTTQPLGARSRHTVSAPGADGAGGGITRTVTKSPTDLCVFAGGETGTFRRLRRS